MRICLYLHLHTLNKNAMVKCDLIYVLCKGAFLPRGSILESSPGSTHGVRWCVRSRCSESRFHRACIWARTGIHGEQRRQDARARQRPRRFGGVARQPRHRPRRSHLHVLLDVARQVPNQLLRRARLHRLRGTRPARGRERSPRCPRPLAPGARPPAPKGSPPGVKAPCRRRGTPPAWVGR